jgi:hypothetical protein
METTALNNQEMAQLTSALQKLGPARAVAPSALAASGVQEEFCKIWPKASPILKEIVKYIPVGGAILSALIAALDELAQVVCVTP